MAEARTNVRLEIDIAVFLRSSWPYPPALAGKGLVWRQLLSYVSNRSLRVGNDNDYHRSYMGGAPSRGRSEVLLPRLRGGQLQRVGVARRLYQAPDLVLADELVSALDPQLAAHVAGELNRDAQGRRATLIASLHAVALREAGPEE